MLNHVFEPESVDDLFYPLSPLDRNLPLDGQHEQHFREGRQQPLHPRSRRGALQSHPAGKRLLHVRRRVFGELREPRERMGLRSHLFLHRYSPCGLRVSPFLCFHCSYIEVIHKILKPGGYWINLGPLLYHWQCTEDITMEEMDERYEQSFEISFEEIEEAMKQKGFKFEEMHRVCTPYADNMWGRWGSVTCRRSMMMTLFRGVFFVAKKEEETSHEW